MAYSLRRGEAIDEAAARIVRDQTMAALAALLTADHSERRAVALEARKRCKKVRGVLRLVRGPLGDEYKPTDQAYRSVARALAGPRESEAHLVAFDRLRAATPSDALPADRIGSIRDELVRRAASACQPPVPVPVAVAPAQPATAQRGPAESTDTAGGPPSRAEVDTPTDGDPAATAARLLGQRLEAVDNWTFAVDGWAAVEGGVARTYRRGTRELTRVLDDRSIDGFHDLRKEAKYTWYHLRLLRPAAPSVLVPLAKQYHRLTIGLGDAHDLAELGALILTSPEAFGGESVADQALMVINERRAMVEDGCLGLAVRLYAEETPDLTARLGGYWRLWQRYGDEQPLRPLRPNGARS